MEVVADRRDYEHWNEDQDYMWWEEEGKHQGEPSEYDYDDYNRADVESEATFEAAVDEGYEAAFSTPPDVLT